MSPLPPHVMNTVLCSCILHPSFAIMYLPNACIVLALLIKPPIINRARVAGKGNESEHYLGYNVLYRNSCVPVRRVPTYTGMEKNEWDITACLEYTCWGIDGAGSSR